MSHEIFFSFPFFFHLLYANHITVSEFVIICDQIFKCFIKDGFISFFSFVLILHLKYDDNDDDDNDTDVRYIISAIRLTNSILFYHNFKKNPYKLALCIVVYKRQKVRN